MPLARPTITTATAPQTLLRIRNGTSSTPQSRHSYHTTISRSQRHRTSDLRRLLVVISTLSIPTSTSTSTSASTSIPQRIQQQQRRPLSGFRFTAASSPAIETAWLARNSTNNTGGALLAAKMSPRAQLVAAEEGLMPHWFKNSTSSSSTSSSSATGVAQLEGGEAVFPLSFTAPGASTQGGSVMGARTGRQREKKWYNQSPNETARDDTPGLIAFSAFLLLPLAFQMGRYVEGKEFKGWPFLDWMGEKVMGVGDWSAWSLASSSSSSSSSSRESGQGRAERRDGGERSRTTGGGAEAGWGSGWGRAWSWGARTEREERRERGWSWSSLLWAGE